MSDQFEDIQAKTREVQRIAAEARGEAVSGGGEVRVVAGAGGRVAELDLRMSAFQMSGVELGEVIVETLRAAETKLEADLAATIQGVLGFSDVDLDTSGFGTDGGQR